ncbi:hypothetical protein EVAR_77582_1 [Eumeta japonica]|uniref:Uncharacterized protein n=1 Tax=Eumeta variegata TaxID=151549 RepID=A0A4C1T9D8_EUMVA|nr:hypothetical protein EVAR_77582_1 [Eumeta japonica]
MLPSTTRWSDVVQYAEIEFINYVDQGAASGINATTTPKETAALTTVYFRVEAKSLESTALRRSLRYNPGLILKSRKTFSTFCLRASDDARVLLGGVDTMRASRLRGARVSAIRCHLQPDAHVLMVSVNNVIVTSEFSEIQHQVKYGKSNDTEDYSGRDEHLPNLSHSKSVTLLSADTLRLKLSLGQPEVQRPSEQIQTEAIACQRFSSEAWEKNQVQTGDKTLACCPSVHCFKDKPRINQFRNAVFRVFTKQDVQCATSHGLVCLKNTSAEDLKKLVKQVPEASKNLGKLLSNGPGIKSASDDFTVHMCTQGRNYEHNM